MKEGRRVTNSRARRITSRVHRTINPGRKTISPVHRTRILIVPSNRPTAGNGKVARQVPNSLGQPRSLRTTCRSRVAPIPCARPRNRVRVTTVTFLDATTTTGHHIVMDASKEGGGAEAWVGVGYAVPGDGRQSTAAVLHLVRIGTDKDAPWEVVGTRDTSLTVDTPGYGSTASWPMTVGGALSGVDESLHVRVLGQAGLAGDACCTPAGGENSRWTVQVPRQTPRTGDLTVVVATGGHVVDVERFAITAVRA